MAFDANMGVQSATGFGVLNKSLYSLLPIVLTRKATAERLVEEPTVAPVQGTRFANALLRLQFNQLCPYRVRQA